MWKFTSLPCIANCSQIAVPWYLRPTAPFPQQIPGLRSHRGIPIWIALCSKCEAGFHPLERSYKLPDFVLWKSVGEEEKRPMMRFPKVEAGSVPGIAEMWVKKYRFFSMKNWTVNSTCSFLAFWLSYVKGPDPSGLHCLLFPSIWQSWVWTN